MSTLQPAVRARETFAGCALIAAAMLAVAVMALHPTGHDFHGATDRGAVAWRNAVVHGVAIFAVLLQTSASLAVVRGLRGATVGLAECAFVAWCAATLGVVCAATCSGFVMPAFLVERTDHGAAQAGAEVVWLLNQAFAKVYVVAGGAAMLGWSIAGWRRNMLRATAILGMVVGAGAASLVVAGHLRLDVHGMGIVVLSHEIWWACVGIALLRTRTVAP